MKSEIVDHATKPFPLVCPALAAGKGVRIQFAKVASDISDLLLSPFKCTTEARRVKKSWGVQFKVRAAPKSSGHILSLFFTMNTVCTKCRLCVTLLRHAYIFCTHFVVIVTCAAPGLYISVLYNVHMTPCFVVQSMPLHTYLYFTVNIIVQALHLLCM